MSSVLFVAFWRGCVWFFLVYRINWQQNHNMLCAHKPGSVKVMKLELSGTCGGPSTTPAFRGFDCSYLIYLSFSYCLNIHEHLPLQDQFSLKYFMYVVTMLTFFFVNMNVYCTDLFWESKGQSWPKIKSQEFCLIPKVSLMTKSENGICL